MDPFLEHPAHFPGLHDSMITYLQEFLQGRLPEPYYAAIGDRVWVEVSRRSVGPDVKVLREDQKSTREGDSAGAVAVATEMRTKPIVVHVPHDEVRETFLNIYTWQGSERLVTSIEVLSPANKTPGEHGRDLYLQKQNELLASSTHLVEIDLLRAGQHTTAVPPPLAREKVGLFDYHVCIHRFDQWQDYHVDPIRLPERLPEIAIPLLPGDPAVPVDLQTVLDRCYDVGPYRRRVHYRDNTPGPPLRPDQTEWVTQLLREKGLLPAD
jgi:hypothetical protein